MIAGNYSFGIERDVEKLKANNLDFRKWSNPLEIQCVSPYALPSTPSHRLGRRLPYAPSMKIYCVYGHGKPTEVGLLRPNPYLCL